MDTEKKKKIGSARGEGVWQTGEHEEVQISNYKINKLWTSLVVQWLRLRTSTAGSVGSIPGHGDHFKMYIQRKTNIT